MISATSLALNITRRRLMTGAAVALALPRPVWAAAPERPLRIYYNDDSTDLVTLASPYHKFREDITNRNIEASIDEAVNAGIDVFTLEPGTGWVPLWKSAIYPAPEHFRWFAQTYQAPIDGLAKYVVEGGDIMAAALAHGRKRGVPVLAALRLNDIHTIAFSGRSLAYAQAHMQDKTLPASLHTLPEMMSRVHADHPEWRIDPASTNPTDMVWNWAHPEAVAHKLALASELVENYDIDGIQLDFTRYPRFFVDDVPLAERARVVTGFLSGVRAALDRRRKGRELSLRVPSKFAGFAPLGLDLAALRSLGVNRLNLSSNTFTSQDVDFRAIADAAPGLKLTLELANAKHFDNRIPRPPGDQSLILASARDDISTAYLAQQNGCEGVSLFNFAYYRQAAGPQSDVPLLTREPPFGVIERLKHPAQALCLTQSWFLGTIFPQGLGKLQTPARLEVGHPITLRLNILPPPAGWARGGDLRFEALRHGADAAAGQFSVTINDAPAHARSGADAYSEEGAVHVRRLAFDTSALKPGVNLVRFELEQGDPCDITLVEIYVNCAGPPL